MKYIDITPKWTSVVRFMLRILEDPKMSEAAKVPARAELLRLAEWADRTNETVKKGLKPGKDR